MLRQGWQDDAWAYHDTIGEIRFARRYLANSARRMRLYPAVYVNGTYDDAPEPLDAMPTLPVDVVDACNDAMKTLGSGRLAISQIMHDVSSQLSIAGEGFVHGQTDPQTGLDTWRIRSIGEITVRNDEYVLREVPVDAMGVFGWLPLDPEHNYVSRIWTPHPKFQMLADSPMRSILDSCEELLILSRTVRATGRSRLAGAGILKVPEGLSIAQAIDDNLDPKADPFIDGLTEAMLSPIGDEGTASAVVPLVVRGNADALAQLTHMTMDRPIDPIMMQQRDELIGRIATGIDLPKEVLTGVVDLNHWSAWQVSDDAFRHHIEPHVQECVDCLTVGYFRDALMADPRMQGANAAWVPRLTIWYDPTDLVTHPDRSTDALALHERLVISDASLREATGFTNKDEPSPLEIELRMVRNTKTFPPNVLEALFHVLDPSLNIPPINESGAIPGMSPTGVVPAVPDAKPVAAPALPGPPPTGAGTPTAPSPSTPVIAASGPPVAHGLSRRLVDIDRELRMRLQVAASHAMNTVLSRAGAKVRSKLQKDERLRTAIAHTPNPSVTATLGPAVVATLGIPGLVDTDWSDVQAVFTTWSTAAQRAALDATTTALGLSPDDPAVQAVVSSQGTSLVRAWNYLSDQLTSLAHDRLYSPDPGKDVAAELDAANADTIVPTNLIRNALNVLGGGNADQTDTGASFNPDSPTVTVGNDMPMGQVGTGSDVTGLLSDSGASQEAYTWVHGFSVRPFEPHEALDGVEFQSFDDEALANSDSFPANEYFVPGDHWGCTCDYMPMWALPSSDSASSDTPPEGEA